MHLEFFFPLVVSACIADKENKFKLEKAKNIL